MTRTRLSAMTLIAEGREAEVYRRGDGGVLKLMREPANAPRISREAAALRTLAAAGHAVPAVFELVTIEGRPGLVMEEIEGVDLLQALARNPLSVLAVGRTMGELHAAIHGCTAPAQLPDLNEELRDQIGAAPLDEELRERALGVRDSLPAGDRLCHGDLHLGNILRGRGSQVPIDWGNASRGDAIADVARTDLIHRLGDPAAPGVAPLLRLLVPIGRRALVVRYLSSYRRQRALDGALLDRWRIVRAAARLCEPIPAERARLVAFLRRRLIGA